MGILKTQTYFGFGPASAPPHQLVHLGPSSFKLSSGLRVQPVSHICLTLNTQPETYQMALSCQRLFLEKSPSGGDHDNDICWEIFDIPEEFAMCEICHFGGNVRGVSTSSKMWNRNIFPQTRYFSMTDQFPNPVPNDINLFGDSLQMVLFKRRAVIMSAAQGSARVTFSHCFILLLCSRRVYSPAVG